MNGQVTGYIRVSTTEQNVARQEEAIGPVDRLFVDRASGKARGGRPGLDELLRWIRDGDSVKVASMDRLARSVVDLHQIVDEITGRGARVEFLKEGLVFGQEPNDATSRLLLGVMGAVAEFERTIIRERQAEGIAAAKARGVYRGRQRALTPEAARAAQLRVEAGVPKAQVARDLGVSRQTLYNALAAVGVPA